MGTPGVGCDQRPLDAGYEISPVERVDLLPKLADPSLVVVGQLRQSEGGGRYLPCRR